MTREPARTQTQPANPFPSEGTQQYTLLRALLEGKKITPLSAIIDMNILVVQARVSELRRLGWPVRSDTIPHPNPRDFPNERMAYYFLDQHFRRWIATEGKGKHPGAYAFKDGRGKFADWDEGDYQKDANQKDASRQP